MTNPPPPAPSADGAGQATDGADQATDGAGLATGGTVQATGRAGQATGRAGQATGRAGQATGRAGQATGRAGQATGRAGQATGRAGQATGRAGQATGGIGRKLVRWSAYALAGLVVLAAAALVGLRLLLPELGHYRPQIEQWLSHTAGRKVEIGAVDARWRGWTPVFHIRDIRLAGDENTADPSVAETPTDPSVETPTDLSAETPTDLSVENPTDLSVENPTDLSAHDAIRLADLTFSLDLPELLRSGVFQPRELSASGASFVVTHRSDGTFAFTRLGFGPDAPGGPGTSDGLARWMLDQTNLSLYGSRIIWVDERFSIGPLPLDGVTLSLERTGERHLISGSFEPSDAGRVDFAMEITGDLLTSSWTGTTYLSAVDVDLARFGLDVGPGESSTVSGVVSAEVWSTWKDRRPVEATGTIRAQSPGVVRGEHRHGVDEAKAEFRAERTPQGWALAVQDLVVATPGGSWPTTSVDAVWNEPGDADNGTLIVNAESARIEDLVALVAPGDETAANAPLRALAQAAPSGILKDMQFSVPVADRIDFERFRASGRFTGLGVGTQAGPVSVADATGRFEASGQGVIADIAAGRVQVDIPDRLEQPLRGEKLAGTLTAASTPEGFRVRLEEARIETPVGTVTANGRLLVPRDESTPELEGALSFGDARINTVRDLVGNLLMPEAALRWLDQAAPFGDIREARVAFRGRLPDPPAGGGENAIEATATLFVPVLTYAAGWPEATGLSAEVRFAGRRLDVRIDSGRILKSAVRDTTVTIEDVNSDAPVARVTGRVEGTSADALHFLSESPLRARFAPLFDPYTFRGDSTIDLEVAVPLTGPERSVSARGRITLDHNRIDGPGLGGGLTAVNGPLTFRNAGVRSDGVTAVWLGEPIQARVGASPADPDATRITIGGRLTRRLLAAYLRHPDGLNRLDAPTTEDPALLARVRGDAAWTATFDLPADFGASPTALRITSDLTGLAVDLPPPFGKLAGTTRMLRIDTRLGADPDRVLEVSLGSAASARLRLVRDAGRFRLERGAIHVGGSRAALPDSPAIIVRGETPALDTAAWQTVFDEVTALREPEPEPDSRRPGLPQEVSIDTASMTALGGRFPDTRIRAARSPDGAWRVSLDGAHLQGSISLPRPGGADPVIADFDRVVYEPDSAETEREPLDLDPRTLPALSFSTRKLLVGERDFGQVGFTTAPSERGLDITELKVRSDSFTSDATGSWSLAGEQHLTEFTLRMHGDDLRQMLETLGFDGSALAGGTTDISLRGSWAGVPTDFAVENLSGVTHFRSNDGRLTQLEQGLTRRVFGLLTITSLPRRLLLDFGDIFKEGFGYDRIEGSFAIENGNAYTSDLYVESDIARFDVVGRTGLLLRDYDQIVTVTPKISSTLPLVPIWIAQKIVNFNLFDKAFSYQYTIRGTWDEPDVELVRTQRREDASLAN
ncbi:MAG: DUF3971 domain-containing protein [Thiotrichales bacterium]|nr:DUF3971 domain-containing protein [Thiotrichales bacterium]